VEPGCAYCVESLLFIAAIACIFPEHGIALLIYHSVAVVAMLTLAV
jgi:hypothetical protein